MNPPPGSAVGTCRLIGLNFDSVRISPSAPLSISLEFWCLNLSHTGPNNNHNPNTLIQVKAAHNTVLTTLLHFPNMSCVIRNVRTAMNLIILPTPSSLPVTYRESRTSLLSLLLEHEQRLLEEAERVRRKQADHYDSDEEAVYGGQETITAQDQKDTWELNLKHFQPALRDRDYTAPASSKDSSPRRCLGDSLVLLVKQTVGKGNIWLLPQAQWEAGETLPQTAARGLTSLPEADFKATFLGNTPCGVYKYKFPKDVRTEGCVGAKVFFFKALLSTGSASQSAGQKESFLWAKKTELQGYLKPAYLEKVNRFILNL
uniref:Large ribosomal subunit protein mL46 n=1 Tax=Salmo trutta TaxID=8032 RepID=A0A674AQF7_SALTR